MNIADNKEFRAVMADQLKDIDPETINRVIDTYPEALAIWLRYGGDNADSKDHYFGQNKEIVCRLHHVPERVHSGEASADGVLEAAHISLHIKASANTLRHLSEKFGLEVKNG